MPALRMPLLRADQLIDGDHVTQAPTITSHASIMVWRDGVHVGNMTEAQLQKAQPRAIRHPLSGYSMGVSLLITNDPASPNATLAARIQRIRHASCF